MYHSAKSILQNQQKFSEHQIIWKTILNYKRNNFKEFFKYYHSESGVYGYKAWKKKHFEG